MSELNVYHHELRHNEYAEFYIKYEADKVIATIKAERDDYEYERDYLRAKLDWIESERDDLSQVKSAAAYLLENYYGAKPSAGDVDALAEDLTKLLTEKYHISKGII